MASAVLSTREIFETLLLNKQVVFKSFNTEEATALLNNLNVMKSRENRLLSDLGFEEKDVIIRMKPVDEHNTGIVFYLEKKQAKKRYSVFIIDESPNGKT